MGRDTKTKRTAEQLERDVAGELGALTVADITDVSSRLANLTDSEVQQLESIGTTTITLGNWTVMVALSSRLPNLTDSEVQQLESIGTTTISAGNWTVMVGLSSRLANLTDSEVQQLEAIGAVTISNAQWALLGGIPILTNSKLLGTDAGGSFESKNAVSFISGTANEITVIDDTDGTVTIEGAGSDTDFTVVSGIQAGGFGALGFQYKTRTLTMNGGIITTVGAESGWNDL